MGRKTRNRKAKGKEDSVSFFDPRKLSEPSVRLRNVYDRRDNFPPTEILPGLEKITSNLGREGWLHPTDTEVLWIILGALCDRQIKNEDLKRMAKIIESKKLYNQFRMCCTHIIEQDVENSGKKLKLEYLLRAICKVTKLYLTVASNPAVAIRPNFFLDLYNWTLGPSVLNLKIKQRITQRLESIHLQISDNEIDGGTQIRPHHDSVHQDGKIITENVGDSLAMSEESPDDIADWNIVPNQNDIFWSGQIYLRPNFICRPYPDLKTYQDVQFRLLMEDFMKPLRQGMAKFFGEQYRQLGPKGVRELRIYENVRPIRFLQDSKFVPERETSWRLCSVEFQRLPRVNWNTSRRLIHGSLVCLWDRRNNHLIIASVANSSPEELTSGRLTLALETPFIPINFIEKEYVMLESTVFFEPYRAVLQVIQKFTENSFPMMEYFLGWKTQLVPPLYLEKHTGYVLRNLNGTTSSIQNLLRFPAWPNSEQLGLDERQHEALQIALTSRVALIQGPPGTGKTFLALRILKSLLDNKHLWQGTDGGTENLMLYMKSTFKEGDNWHLKNKLFWKKQGGKWLDDRAPVVVICFTNHALDQFLEGILGSTNRIIRIGGQSKSPKLENFGLHRIKFNVMNTQHSGPYCDSNYLYYDYKIKELRAKIEVHIQSKIRNPQLEILKIDELQQRNVISVEIYEAFKQAERRQVEQKRKRKRKDNILKCWLGWSNHRQLLKVLRETRMELNKRNQMTKNIAVLTEEIIVENLQEEMEVPDRTVTDIIEETIDDEDYREEVRLAKQQANIEILDNNPRENDNGIRQRLDPVNEEDQSLVSFAKHQIQQMQYIRDLLLLETNDVFQEESFSADEIMTMPLSRRWMLFALWKRSYEEIINEELQEFKEKIREYNQLKGEALAALCRTADVIGMTTTGAAKNRLLLESLKAKIVIVEEAAEVLESHIVCSLTPDCQHLIMIGDHQQLRPSVNVHQLATKYHLDVSLFERLIMGGMKAVRLGVQHRMRPEIARLIVPAVYAQLENHTSVYSHPHVPGMMHDVFFYHHTHPEKEDGSSFYNEHEAAMALQLALYLVRNQHVSAHRIAILATYTAQLHQLLNSRRNFRHELTQVRMTVVDNFQGEENDVIILSLVRNNKRNSVGFLRTDNRICVALSRARNGLYILGNISLLSTASPLWAHMEKVLMENGEIGEEIPLRCNRNHQTIFKVNQPEGFPIGNFCREMCGAELSCGHACKLVCHKEGKHTRTCLENVTKKLHCGHDQLIPCSTPISKALCQQPVIVTKMPCMHEIQIRCCKLRNHANEVPCTSMVFKNLPCGHIQEIPCYMPPDAVDATNACKVKIEYKLNCSHITKIACGTSEINRMFLNVSCKEMVHKRLLCGHSKWMKCNVDLSEIDCGKTDERKLDCGHLTQFICPGKPITIPCLTMVDRRMPCGHTQKSVCSKPIERCHQEIVRRLDCGHDVQCLCWNKSPTCTAIVKKMLMCGHLQPVRCIEGIDSVVCNEQVEVLHPLCSHVQLVPCSVANDEIQLRSFKCTAEPLKMLQCGHELRLPCAKEIDDSITCNVMINYTLPCHHMVSIPCSTTTAKPKEKCKIKCGMPLDCDHYCSLPCHDKTKAHACTETVQKQLKCGHKKDIPCFRVSDKEICFSPVSLKLACGHMWNTTCDKVSSLNEIICRVTMKKRLSCGHTAQVECCIPPEKIFCKEPLEHKLGCRHSVLTKCGVSLENKLKLTCTVEETKKLPCGHTCLLKCGSKEASKPLSNIFCRMMVEKNIPKCGHKVKVECGKKLSKNDCTSVCEKTLDCGHRCPLPCREPCATKSCQQEVKLEGIHLPCGHKLKGECRLRYVDQDVIQAKLKEVKQCTSTCQARLACGHRCSASCQECQANRFHSVCVKCCNRILICGHKCEDKCAKVCPPCKKPCNYQCIHQKCTESCGNDCTFCTKNCEWKCPHAQCKHSCSEFCKREPCNEPCRKRFSCGHLCISLCGEICPPKCPSCSNIKIPNFNRGARYIYLECEHYIEVKEMDDWMNENYESEDSNVHKIWCPLCPQCEKPIRLCYRYGDKIKAFYVDLISIKWNFVNDGTIRTTQEWQAKINKACDKWFEPESASENHPLKFTFSHLKAEFNRSFSNDQCWDLLYRIQLTALIYYLNNDAKKTYEISYNGKKERFTLAQSSKEYLSSKVKMGLHYMKKHANTGVGYYHDLYKVLNRFDLHRQYFVVEALSTRLPPSTLINQTQLDKAAHLFNGVEKWTDAGERTLVDWFSRISNMYNVTLISTSSDSVKKKLIQRLDMSSEMWLKCAQPICEAVFSRTRYMQCPECLDACEPGH